MTSSLLRKLLLAALALVALTLLAVNQTLTASAVEGRVRAQVFSTGFFNVPGRRRRSGNRMPNGKRFVAALRADATGGQKGSVHVTVLMNFFDELRRTAPGGK